MDPTLIPDNDRTVELHYILKQIAYHVKSKQNKTENTNK